MPAGLGKIWIFEIFQQKRVFITSSNGVTFFSLFLMIEKFNIAARHSRGKCGADPKRGFRFAKEYSLTGFEKMSF